MTMFNEDGSDKSQTDFDTYKKRFAKEDGTVDLDGLLKKSYNQETHIEKLEDEGNRFRDDLKSRTTMEELLAEIKRSSKTPNSSDDTQHLPNDVDKNPPNVDEAVKSHLSSFKQELAYERNTEFVKTELTKAWGPDYVSKLRAKAKELGETEEFLSNLAATKPKTFLSLVNPATSKVADYSPPKNELRTPAGQSFGLNNYADFEKVRKEDPNLYWSPSVQNKLYEAAKAAKARGEDFYKKS